VHPVGYKVKYNQMETWVHVQNKRVITIDKNPSYPAAIEILKKNKELLQEILMRQVKFSE
jgi:transposase-like protein